jgi:hypothetical protein
MEHVPGLAVEVCAQLRNLGGNFNAVAPLGQGGRGLLDLHGIPSG